MSNLREAAKQALEALENHTAIKHPQQIHYRDSAIYALRAALAEPKHEPFGYLWSTGMHPEFRFTQQQLDGVDGMPVYAAPAPTAEDIAQDWDLLKATQESLREHMAEIQRLRTALEQQADPLIEEQRLDIVATALRGHASTRDAIQWAIEAVERHHGIKGSE